MYPSNHALPFGFRILGDCRNDRRLVDWSAAFLAYCDCDDRAQVESEAYLSAFCFGSDFAKQLDATGTTKGYIGPTWSPWLWMDIDRDEIENATNDVRRLVAFMLERYSMAGDELLLFYSGSKGYHVGLPLSVCGAPSPSIDFHLTCRRFAESVAAVANVAIDSGVYDRVRAFRAPNSRHPKTGRHKRFFELDALMGLKPSRLFELAAEPQPFDLPTPPRPNTQAVRDWQAAVAVVESEKSNATTRRQAGGGCCSLTRSTLEFIRDGAATGDRHRRLFSAAANLAEFGCGFDLAFALLSESALDSGLPPSEVRRQIECGLRHAQCQTF